MICSNLANDDIIGNGQDVCKRACRARDEGEMFARVFVLAADEAWQFAEMVDKIGKMAPICTEHGSGHATKTELASLGWRWRFSMTKRVFHECGGKLKTWRCHFDDPAHSLAIHQPPPSAL